MFRQSELLERQPIMNIGISERQSRILECDRLECRLNVVTRSCDDGCTFYLDDVSYAKSTFSEFGSFLVVGRHWCPVLQW